MTTFYNTLGSYTQAEIPQIPVTDTVVGSVLNNISLEWTDETTLTGYTYVIQVWNGSTWVDNRSYPETSTSGVTTGITTAGTYKVRVAILKDGKYYPNTAQEAIVQDNPQYLTGDQTANFFDNKTYTCTFYTPIAMRTYEWTVNNCNKTGDLTNQCYISFLTPGVTATVQVVVKDSGLIVYSSPNYSIIVT